MRFGRRHVWIAAALGASLVAIAGLAYHRKHRVPCFPYIGQSLTPGEFDALASRPGWRIRVLDVKGAQLRGLVRSPSAPESPWILFFGGNSRHLIQDGVRFLDGVIAGRDWGGAVWAYRGYDGSSGAPDPTALTDDASEAYAELVRNEHATPDRVHLVGFSLGTAVAAALCERGTRVASVTLLAPTTELDMHPPGGACRDRFETVKYLDAIKGPTLVVHGARDETLPISGSRWIVSRLSGHAQLIEHPTLGHLELPETRSVMDEVRAFVAAH